MRQVHRVSTEAVEFDGVQRRKQISADPSRGQRLKGASQKVAQEHHPPGRETHTGRKEFCAVRGFPRSIRNGFYELSIDISDRKQDESAQRKSQNRSQR